MPRAWTELVTERRYCPSAWGEYGSLEKKKKKRTMGHRTLLPTTRDSPSGAHARVNASPRPLISLMQVFDRTSQNFTTPSLLTLHNSASFTGLKATFSIGAEWPFKSVEKRTFGFSGFPSQVGHVSFRTSAMVPKVLTDAQGFV